MAMVFINKAVLMQYASSMTLLTLQQLATTMLIYCGRVMGYTKAKGVNVETAKKLILVSLFYNANVAFALASLKGVNIPMYIAIKRLTPLAVLIAGFFSGKGRPSTQVILSVVLTAAGVMIAALGDFSFDLVGYSMAFTSVFFQTMYLVLVEKSGAEDGLSSVEIMFYNSFLSLPFLVFLIIATGEFPDSLSLLLYILDTLPLCCHSLIFAKIMDGHGCCFCWEFATCYPVLVLLVKHTSCFGLINPYL
ncbi:UDP-galactose/UDP-glucose transporter 7-like isoform X1 [Camellia sinensis]|uniref:UDP-galactose/UDP-glucose transporter 7-like isoform X1 n=1 Tax=Camellia sinensis TaxID=4442 RepID=UPI0010366D7B|nr:UDP-galactose/UDP-glucose transporter 7-like isoform X1 [Camellia sinensis]